MAGTRRRRFDLLDESRNDIVIEALRGVRIFRTLQAPDVVTDMLEVLIHVIQLPYPLARIDRETGRTQTFKGLAALVHLRNQIWRSVFPDCGGQGLQ